MAFDVTKNVVSGRGTREDDYEQLRANLAHLKTGNPNFTWTPQSNLHLSTSPAGGPTARNDHQVLAFDKDAIEHCFAHGVMPESYAGGDLTVGVFWAAPTLTTGSVVWQTVFLRYEEDVDDLDSDTFGTGVVVADAAPGTAGYVSFHGQLHDSDAERDSLAPGDAFAIRVGRVGSNGSDTLDEDAHLLRVTLRESTPGAVGLYDETDLAAVGGSLRHSHWQQLFDNGQALQSGNPWRDYLEPQIQTPASGGAGRTTRGRHPVLAFDGTTSEVAYIPCAVNSYAGLPNDGSTNGITVDVWWCSASGTTGAVTWRASVELWLRGGFGLDLDSDAFGTSDTETTPTSSGSSGRLKRTRLEIRNTSSRLLEELADGSAFRIKLERLPADAGDTMNGIDAQVARVVVGQQSY